MYRLISYYTKRTVIGVTIATNYWIQYHRRDRQSLQMSQNSGFNHRFHLRSVQMGDLSTSQLNANQKPDAFTKKWFEPFVSISEAVRAAGSNPSAGTDNKHMASGFICDARGFVVTQFGSEQPLDGLYLVRLGNGREVLGQYVHTISGVNIAILKLKTSGQAGGEWPVVEFGRHNDLQVDDRVYTVGTTRCPLHNQVNEGTVFTANAAGDTNPVINPSEKLFKHSVLINPNDSGRPLVNADGQVVGITVVNKHMTDNIVVPVIYGSIDGIYGLITKYIYNYVDGKSGPPLGLVVYWLDDEWRQVLNSNPIYKLHMTSDLNGILVWKVSDSFYIHVNDLKRFDVITHINGLPVRSMAHMYRAVRAVRTGLSVRLSVNGKQNVFTINPSHELFDLLSADLLTDRFV